VQVLFDGEFHPPYPETDKNEKWFEWKKKSLTPQEYEPRDIRANEIPEIFRTGQGHPTSLWRDAKDPVEIAREIYGQYCQ
jgi:hypothetical protein